MKDPASSRQGEAPVRMHLNASQKLVIGFALLVLTGALLLNLPFASNNGESIGFLDALFTATSATCVTGLVVANTLTQWTWFGKLIIILLIQIGGLGVMTVIASAMLLLHRQISLRDRLVIQTAFNQDNTGGMVRLILHVLRLTFFVELLGAVLLAIGFYCSPGASLSVGEAAIQGIFHSISAFCNAGFDIVGDQSLAPYVANPLINLTIILLIVGGGIGYPVWRELIGCIRQRVKEKISLRTIRSHLSVHTKTALSVTAVLVFGGALLFLLLEWKNPATLAPLTPSGKLWAALFQSVTLRTAGYTTVDQAGLYEASQFLSSILMFIGGSPAGTAGGIKTVTLGVIVFSMISALRGRDRIEAFRRELSLGLLQKALTVTCLLGIVVLVATMALCFTEQDNPFSHSFLDLLFECSSAAATVGLSTGITPHLSSPGKTVLILSMFIGRLGPVTMAMALSIKLNKRSGEGGEVSLPNAKVIVG